jgi:uncharacterized protein YecE (DUF72 family)
MSNLHIGTSGWNYPSGRGRWNGIFYPARAKRSTSLRAGGKTFDELSYYAERFDTVEVNSTFYGQPRPEVTACWVARTPDHFEFSLKLYQKFTHPEMYRKAAKTTEATVSQADVDEFREGIDPLARADKLGALLAQFPPSFKDSDASRATLDRLLRAFGDYPIAVELRHKSWSDNIASTLTLLNAYHAAWTQIDEPKFKFSIRQNYLPNVKGFYYMRLHGRNVENWWRHEKSEDRYDYLYSADELKPFAETAEAARTLVRKSYLYLNNHFAAKSAANALMIKRMVGQPIDATFTPELVQHYPGLKDFVGQTPESLFSEMERSS